MIKKDVDALVQTLGPFLCGHLEIDVDTIRFHVGSSRSKLLKDLKEKNDFAAICLTNPDATYDIYICTDKQKDLADCIGSITHELLHVRFSEIYQMLPVKKRKKYHELEETIVVSLENLVLGLLGY